MKDQLKAALEDLQRESVTLGWCRARGNDPTSAERGVSEAMADVEQLLADRDESYQRVVADFVDSGAHTSHTVVDHGSDGCYVVQITTAEAHNQENGLRRLITILRRLVPWLGREDRLKSLGHVIPANLYEHFEYMKVGCDWYTRFSKFHDTCQIGQDLTWEEKTVRFQGYENGWNDAQRFLGMELAKNEAL